jgi:hypothetical protein
MLKKILFVLSILAVCGLTLTACSQPLAWPKSPLYEFPESDPNWNQPEDLEAAKEAIVGHYAHFDVVAYEDLTTEAVMLSFIITYGFTDFYLEDGKLYQKNTFLRASQKINQKYTESLFRDEAVQAIKPRVAEVELTNKNGQWHIYRPSTPTLLGITGDPSLPLSRNPDDPNLIDPDNDGNPGVTVEITIAGFIKGEIYITRREIYSYNLTLNSDGNLYGHVVDSSEQFVIDASLAMLAQESNSLQIPDVGMSPIMLVPIDDEIDTLEELMEIRDEIFPKEPEFIEE